MRFALAVLLLAACQNAHGRERPASHAAEPLALVQRETPRPSIDTHGLPPMCVRYLAYIEQFASCPKIPADAAKAIRDAGQQAATAWRQMSPPNTQYVETACVTGVRALVQSVQANGC